MMKIFLLDLWHDLKEKRLWPVAVVLLAGLVAVPVLLAKPADKASAPAPVANAAAPKADELKQLAKVKLGDDEPGDGSTLGVFDPDNPFTPPKGAIKKQTDSASSTSGPSDGNTSATPNGGADTGGNTGGGTTGGTVVGTPGPTPGDDGGDNTGGTITTVYKYVVDVTFRTNGHHTRRIKGLEKLDMLPSQSSPLLIFMGVTPKGSNAVFLVDSTLEAAGEGRCKPSASECALAYIGAGAEHIFTEEDGDTYTLRIDEIRKVKVTPDGNSAKAGGAKARASIGPPRRFVSPLIADLVVVASDSVENSDSDTESR